MTVFDLLTILQHNVNGWNAHKTALKTIYKNIDPHIILINHTGLLNGQNPKIDNYNTFSSNKTNDRFDGTAICIRKDIGDYRLHDDFDCDLLAITVRTRQGQVTIGTEYSPPKRTYLNQTDYIDFFNRDAPTYFIGDLNARHTYFGHSNCSQVGKNVHRLIELDYCKHEGPDFPTLLRHNSATSPDIVLTNMKTFHNLQLRPGPMTTSDHIPIIANISIEPFKIPIVPRKSMRHADWDGYRRQLENQTLTYKNNMTIEEIDDSLERWTKTVQQAADDNIPTITKRTVPGIKPTHETRLLEIQYNATVDEILRTGPTAELNRRQNDLKQQLQTEYQRLHNRVWDDLVEKLDDEPDCTRFWKTIKRLKGNNKQTTPYLRDHENNKVYDVQDKERLFRNHWTKIFSIDDDPENTFDHEHTRHVEQSMTVRQDMTRPYRQADTNRLDETCTPITLGELNKTLITFKQKAPGPSGITAQHLKQLPLNMKQHLTHIFNQTLSLGYFPKAFKIATMIFIPKSNTSQYNITNYRPISLLNVEGKLLDKIINTRLTQQLEDNSYTSDKQHGFRKHRGTHTALALFHETLSLATTQKLCTDIILRDVTKAFDRVWHIGLKYKLTQTNLHPCYIRILSDYLTDRQAKIRIGSHIGPPFPLNSGVPQGACLSPTLFSFYTHDIPPPLPNTDYIMFADDITQITAGKYKPRDAARNTQHAIQQIDNYQNRWKITSHKDKFKIIPISRRKTQDITIGNRTHTYTNSGKMLGLTFTTWGITKQGQIRASIAKHNLQKLYRFRKLSTRNKLKLYNSTVRSALIYPTIPLHTLSKTSVLTLQRVQNRALRFITNTKWDDFTTAQALHQQCNLPPINQLLHAHAQNTWKSFRIKLPHLYHLLKYTIPEDTRRHTYFPSSLQLAEGPLPEPVYK